jgi:hypothetical protein
MNKLTPEVTLNVINKKSDAEALKKGPVVQTDAMKAKRVIEETLDRRDQKRVLRALFPRGEPTSSRDEAWVPQRFAPKTKVEED